MMEWGQPHNFIWLWTMALAVAVFGLASFRKRSQMRRFGDAALVQRLILSFDPRKRWFKRALLLLSLGLVVAALCQPHFRTKEVTVERKGVDVMIAVDVSQSMLAKDIAPSRLQKAKLELSTLIDRLKQDRMGVVAFAGEAFIQCPLTLDRSAVKLFLSSIQPDLIPTPGTMIGPAIETALQAFSEKEKEFKALILLTDGEDHGSRPLESAKRAAAQGVKIFTIGVGTSDGSTLPTESTREGFKKDRQGRVVLSKLDEGLLKEIAQMTGGAYYRSSRGELEIESLVRAIRAMAQKGLKSEKTIEYDESFQYFLIPALLFLFAEIILSERKRK
jgi:Ca-activated chloride channel family protein